jgi:hypothetical protein
MLLLQKQQLLLLTWHAQCPPADGWSQLSSDCLPRQHSLKIMLLLLLLLLLKQLCVSVTAAAG